MTELERIDRCVQSLKEKLNVVPDRAVILGSGLGGLTGRMSDCTIIPYGDIPGFPQPTVEGHRGEMIVGQLGGKHVLAMAGRFHYYEGHPLATVIFPARVLARLGIRSLLITNAAGGVNQNFVAGDLMLIRDHLNMTGRNPLEGDNIDELGTRFPDMSKVYSPKLMDLAGSLAASLGQNLREGVYAWMSGPSYETPAEIRMLRSLGADAVGMSTVPEAIAAVHAGIEVAGISLITNMAAGVLDQALTHQEVTECANAAAPRFEALVEALLGGM